VTVLARVAAYIIAGFVHAGRLVQAQFGLADGRRLRRVVVTECSDRDDNERTDQECFNEFIHSSALPLDCCD